MSRRVVSVLAVIFAVMCAAAAFVWLHAGGQNKTVVEFTPDPPAANSGAAREAGPTAAAVPPNPPANASSPKPALNAGPAPGFTPTSGEVLAFPSTIAKANHAPR